MTIEQLLKVSGVVSVGVLGFFSMWNLIENAIVSELTRQHQEDVLRIQERYICWNQAEQNMTHYQICMDEYERLAVLRRIKAQN